MRTNWFKSTFSGEAQTCVEISLQRDAVLIRDSKYTGPTATQPIIIVTPTDWQPFLDLALSGTSGRLPSGIMITLDPTGGATITAEAISLTYNAAEWDAFTKGIADGQFTHRP
ncbi:DUF397 domain-containing protein [Nocardia sp. NPDC051570]|uniref:DUF397 domain-containing protein n=1 Tax=Nocardia sp. NPDC051570 TaxID=3364324 RepID=UPI0037991DE6